MQYIENLMNNLSQKMNNINIILRPEQLNSSYSFATYMEIINNKITPWYNTINKKGLIYEMQLRLSDRSLKTNVFMEIIINISNILREWQNTLSQNTEQLDSNYNLLMIEHSNFNNKTTLSNGMLSANFTIKFFIENNLSQQ